MRALSEEMGRETTWQEAQFKLAGRGGILSEAMRRVVDVVAETAFDELSRHDHGG